MSTNDPNGQPASAVSGWDRAIVVALGAAGCALSYDSLQQMAVAVHVREWLSYLFPVVIDGFIAYGVRALLVLREAPMRARLYLWSLFGVATGTSVWANAVHAVRLNDTIQAVNGLQLGDRVVAVLSTIAPLALAGATHLYILIAREGTPSSKEEKTPVTVDRATGPGHRVTAADTAPVLSAQRPAAPVTGHRQPPELTTAPTHGHPPVTAATAAPTLSRTVGAVTAATTAPVHGHPPVTAATAAPTLSRTVGAVTGPNEGAVTVPDKSTDAVRTAGQFPPTADTDGPTGHPDTAAPSGQDSGRTTGQPAGHHSNTLSPTDSAVAGTASADTGTAPAGGQQGPTAPGVRAGQRSGRDPDTQALLDIARTAVKTEGKLTRKVVAEAIRGRNLPLSNDRLTDLVSELRGQPGQPGAGRHH
jgi:hypothetical protein